MKAQLKTGLCFAAACLAFGLGAPDARAFSLLGPFESWMTTTNGFNPSDESDIGGPMCISNEYRWNVPVVTYGFDQSFLDYFGTNGVAAVESAIQILNDLPPASQIVLTNFPLDSTFVNYEAQSLSLYDLKSQTLSLLLEHMGLASPTRYVFVLRQWNPVFISDPSELSWPDGTIPNYIVQRNFDPQTLLPSVDVNQTLYSSFVESGLPGYENSMVMFAVDPLAPTYTAVADFPQSIVNDYSTGSGVLYTGLTYDDVGGLAYLLSTNNINYETLLPGIYGVGVNSNSFVNGAWRSGVDKITFIAQPLDSQSGAFLPTTNSFTDTYITNGAVMQQQLARVISQPDFLFSAGDVTYGSPGVSLYSRTGTTNWLNNATANGNTNGAGPGVIQPPVKIAFDKLGRTLGGSGTISDVSAIDESIFWGTFDNTTNAPIVYPILKTGTNQLTVRMWLTLQNFQRSFDWSPVSPAGTPFAFQTSTDLNRWVTIFSVTNNGSVSTYLNSNPLSTSRFYRLVPQ